MWTYDYFSPFSYRNNSAKYEDAHEDEKRIFSLTESFWFSVTSMTPQVKVPRWIIISSTKLEIVYTKARHNGINKCEEYFNVLFIRR